MIDFQLLKKFFGKLFVLRAIQSCKYQPFKPSKIKQ